MEDWITKFRTKLEENNIEIFLLTKYVDDILIIRRNLDFGAYWNGDKISYWKSVKEKYISSGMTRECSQGDEPMPCLDTQLWVGTPEGDPWYKGEKAKKGEHEKSQVQVPLYKFYKKPVAVKIGTLTRSAVAKKRAKSKLL